MARKCKGGKLPPHVMVYFVMALALFAEKDYEETWVRLQRLGHEDTAGRSWGRGGR
jgi:hypothetical protein